MAEGGGADPPDGPPRPPESYLYSETTKYSSFKVIIAKTSANASAFEINEIIRETYTRKEMVLEQFGKRVIAYCGSAKIANNLTSNKCLRDSGYNAYIPLYFVATAIVVWDVDTNISEDWLIKNIHVPEDRKVLRVFRMKRKITTNAGTPEWIPARRIKVFVEGQGAPQRVFFDCISCQCNLFVKRYIQCGNCYKFNHTANRCVNEKICKGCGRPAHEEICEIPKCAGCGGSHLTSSPNCTAKIRQRNMNQAMAEEMLSWDEANRKFPVIKRNSNTYVSVVSTNPYAALSMEEEDFPPLPEPREPPQQRNQQVQQKIQPHPAAKRKNTTRALTQPKKTLKQMRREQMEEDGENSMQGIEEGDIFSEDGAPLEQREDLHRKLQDSRNRLRERNEIAQQRQRGIITSHEQQEQFFGENLQSVSGGAHTQPPAGGSSDTTHGGAG